MHTPETKAGRDPARVKTVAEENGLHFPIAIDNDKAIWNAWGNGWWPTVYLVDKAGYVRFWWSGELNWNGAGGQKVVRSHIRTLLAEQLSSK